MATRVRLGTFSPSVVLRTARRRGHLAEAGLEVDEVPVASSPAQFSALADGELDLAVTSPDNVLAYRFSHRNPLHTRLDARIVAAVDRGLALGLYARPGLVEADQLRGADVAVDVPTSGFALALYALTDHLGLAREDYRTPALGSTPRRLEALLAGECDATMLNAGNEILAERAGCVRLATVAQVCSPYVGTVLACLGEAQLEQARMLARALALATDDIVSGVELDDVRAEAREALGLDDDLAAEHVKRLRDPAQGLVPGGGHDIAALRTVVGLRRRHLPEVIDGRDVLEDALDPTAGLLVPPSPGEHG